jgi:excisionase family DNA binding protein
MSQRLCRVPDRWDGRQSWQMCPGPRLAQKRLAWHGFWMAVARHWHTFGTARDDADRVTSCGRDPVSFANEAGLVLRDSDAPARVPAKKEDARLVITMRVLGGSGVTKAEEPDNCGHKISRQRQPSCRQKGTPMTLSSSRSSRRGSAPDGRGTGQSDPGRRSVSGDAGLNRGLLRVEEAADWLGLSRTKAYELVYRGSLPSVTIGRSRRVPVAALQAFVERLIESGGLV